MKWARVECAFSPQALAEAEDSLREFEQRVSEMRSKGETVQPDPVSTQELLKLQVQHLSNVLDSSCGSYYPVVTEVSW